MIAVLDLGTGNIRSIFLALRAVAPHENISVTSDLQKLKKANKIVFPGQGSMNGCVEKLRTNGLFDEITKVISDKPFLGICLGKQILFERSEEGNSLGLGIFEGSVKKFKSNMESNINLRKQFKIPHMGWNQVKIVKKHYVFKGFQESINGDQNVSNWFYFVHSFFVQPSDSKIILAHTFNSTVSPSQSNFISQRYWKCPDFSPFVHNFDLERE